MGGAGVDTTDVSDTDAGTDEGELVTDEKVGEVDGTGVSGGGVGAGVGAGVDGTGVAGATGDMDGDKDFNESGGGGGAGVLAAQIRVAENFPRALSSSGTSLPQHLSLFLS